MKTFTIYLAIVVSYFCFGVLEYFANLAVFAPIGALEHVFQCRVLLRGLHLHVQDPVGVRDLRPHGLRHGVHATVVAGLSSFAG